MIYEVHVPKGVLAKYIDNIVFFEGYTAQHKADKLLPDGGIYMIINMLEKEIENVRKEIINEKDISKKFELIENYFLKTIRKEYEKNLAFMEVLEFLATSPHLANISQLSDKMNVSQKHLITLFNKQVGLTPKALARIFRFQKVILQLEEKEKTDWLQIAIDCGYYDQAHFV